MKTILFDLDGTLIESTDAILESFEAAYDTLGELSPHKDDIKSLIGYPLDIMFTKLGIKGDVWSYVSAYKEHYRLISKAKTSMLPLAINAIEEASRIATLGIVTTKTARYSRELLEHMNVMHHFKVLVGRENVENPKPHAEPILKAMELLNSDKDLTWMIGDTILDLNSAKNAGVKSIAVLCGYGAKRDLQEHANFVVNDSLEAVRLISGKYK